MLRRPPGPRPHFIIGNIPLASRDPLAVFLNWSREFGDIFYYRAGWLHIYFLNHPDLIESVLVRNPASFQKDRVIRNSRWFFGNGLLTSEGDFWLRQRRLSQPAFHRERVASYAQIMTGYAEEMLATWQSGETRDIHAEMMDLALRIVVRALFNVEAEETVHISAALNALMRNATGIRMLYPPAGRYLPTPKMIELRRAVLHLEQTVYGIIEQRRADNRDAGDLLSMLMQVRDEDGGRMSDQQLRDEVLTFLLAGHETTALALSWTWHLLGQHPEAEQKLHSELDRVLAGRVPAFSDLSVLPYTEAVIRESMRLYPPAWSLARSVIADVELGGYVVPKGSNIAMSQWVMHRHPAYFSDPDTFIPGRWLGDKLRKLPRFVYFPFGGGPRQCIGAAFAQMEAAILLATIAQRFRFHAAPNHSVVPVPSFTLRPKNGIRMRIEEREKSFNEDGASPRTQRAPELAASGENKFVERTGMSAPNNSLRPQVQYVHIRSQTHVVREIPTHVIGVVVSNNVVAVPQPVATVANVVRRNREEKSIKAKPVWPAAMQPPNMARSDSAAKVPMLWSR